MTIAKFLAILALASTVAVVTDCLSLSSRPSTRQRALVLTRIIERDFWDSGKQAYLEVSPRRREGLPYAKVWANGVQFRMPAPSCRTLWDVGFLGLSCWL